MVSRGLLPPELEAGELGLALRALAVSARSLYDADCSVKLRGDTRLEAPGAAVELYRIAQEAVYNAAKHARARAIRIAFSGGKRAVRLLVTDDGIGLPAGAEAGPGLGLAIMRHRARSLGGALRFGSAGRRGTRVVLECARPQR
jgi:signal transduction histidine kinase